MLRQDHFALSLIVVHTIGQKMEGTYRSWLTITSDDLRSWSAAELLSVIGHDLLLVNPGRLAPSLRQQFGSQLQPAQHQHLQAIMDADSAFRAAALAVNTWRSEHWKPSAISALRLDQPGEMSVPDELCVLLQTYHQ